ncbi:MAG TPA: bifunctional lysylphosphatidylglycerol flippase/synthetase MprF [Candidatus Binatia bacterium]|nr:bifunctional lysylphosphatidylglycerol flippase/synthetase MprF [Candidatus Binatia bacterium]
MTPAAPGRWRALAWWIVAHLGQLWPVLVAAVLAVVSWEALHAIDGAALRVALRATDRRWIAAAGAVTLLNLAVMGAYDVVALRRAGVVTRRRWLYGVLAFAWSNFLTLGPVAGPAIRFWLYPVSEAGRGVLQRGIAHIAVAFATALVAWVIASAIGLRADDASAAVTVVALVPVVAVVLALGLGALQRRLRSRFGWAKGPAPWMRLVLLGVLDWGLAGAVFLCVLRAAGADAGGYALVRFFLGQAIGIMSLIPGGLGSADVFWLASLHGPDGAVPAALLVYRGLYYILPWAAASLVLLRVAAGRGVRWVALSRGALATLVGGAGVMLLLSAASPATVHRLRRLEEWLPLSLVEASHVIATLTGVLLLVLARGLDKGYRTAHRVAVLSATLGAIAALLKGFDVEEAVVLAGAVGLLVAQAPLFRQPSHGDWLGWRGVGALVAAVFVFIAFGLLTHDPDALASVHFLDFAHRAEVARFLRGAALLGLAAVAGGLAMLLRMPSTFTPPDDASVARALAMHADLGRDTNALSVANRDKAIWFDDDGGGFCLWRAIGPYLVVLGDPVVQPGGETMLLDRLIAQASEHDRRPLFYQVGATWIPPLHDRGFHFFKLGEEAHVDLRTFGLSGTAQKTLRGTVNRAERDGLSFAIVPAVAVGDLLPELRRVSDAWLASKHAHEKQFSVGFFDATYLTSFPCAVIRDGDGRVVAFANLLQGPGGIELSIDLMRHLPDAPSGTMDFLFARLFAWGRAAGYASFNLGMAPLSTVGAVRGARASERLAHLLFRHGEQWYNFQGLRQYKEKFHPRWVPRYLAYADAWDLVRAMAHVSALIAGGWGVVLRPEPTTHSGGERGGGFAERAVERA